MGNLSAHRPAESPNPGSSMSDEARMSRLGYNQELRRVLGFFENFGIAFCYISPVVGIYSLFVLG
ncbi:MAG TPA: amino acid permease-associated protein, partial [Actinomycetota bacterium]|nr:amino acid permease-associated protein [Actinomycetota bacterium]